MVESSAADTMTDGGVQFFEGVEKLLEIWFACDDPKSEDSGDLRNIPRLVAALFRLGAIVVCLSAGVSGTSSSRC